MVVIKLPTQFTNEFVNKIPRQRALINKLLLKGIIISYTLSGDRSTLWVLMNGDSTAEVSTIIDTFPLREFMSYRVNEVMFHQQAEFGIPQFSLN